MLKILIEKGADHNVSDKADILLTQLKELRHQIDKGIVIEIKRGEPEDLEKLSKKAIE